jgi:hypothetical protein
MKYLGNRRKENHLQSTILFCDHVCIVLLFRLTSLDPPPENGMANFGTTEFSLEIQPTEAIQSAHNLQLQNNLLVTTVLSQDIEESC